MGKNEEKKPELVVTSRCDCSTEARLGELSALREEKSWGNGYHLSNGRNSLYVTEKDAAALHYLIDLIFPQGAKP